MVPYNQEEIKRLSFCHIQPKQYGKHKNKGNFSEFTIKAEKKKRLFSYSNRLPVVGGLWTSRELEMIPVIWRPS